MEESQRKIQRKQVRRKEIKNKKENGKVLKQSQTNILFGKVAKVFSVLSHFYSNNGSVQSTGSLNITVNDSRSP
jgi:hypothetical protein